LLQDWRLLAQGRTARPVRELAALIGSLNFLRLQFRDASLHLRVMHYLKALAVSRGGWTAACTANPSIEGELKWWLHSLTQNTPAPTERYPISAEMTTDASPTGWGAVLKVSGDTLHAFGSWRTQQKALTSNAKELTAVTRGIRHYVLRGELHSRTGLLVRSDNTSTVADINRLSASGTLTEPLLKLVAEAKKHQIQLQAIHIPGVTNGEADRLSRMGLTREYYLKEEYLKTALEHLGAQPNRDIFGASPFMTPEVEPSRLTDALHADWSWGCLFLHPPPHLLTRTVAKALKEGATAVLVAPAWKGAVWSPMLRQGTQKEVLLGPFEDVMNVTPRFAREGWLLPPGDAVAALLAGKTMNEKPSSQDF
jgi:ribonuclease HI